MKNFILCILLLLISACSIQNKQIEGDQMTGEFVFITSQFVLNEGDSGWNLVNYDIPFEDDNVQDIPLIVEGNCIKISRNVCGIEDSTAYIDNMTIQNLSNDHVGIIYRTNYSPTIGTIYLINHDLEVKFCAPQLMEAAGSSFTILPESEILFVGLGDYKRGRVIQYNMDSCSITYTGVYEEGLIGIVQSKKGTVAKLYFAYNTAGQYHEIIKIFSDQDEILFEMKNATMPIFSDNGEMLAYVDADKNSISILEIESFEIMKSDIGKEKNIEHHVWGGKDLLVLITDDNEILSYDINSDQVVESFFFLLKTQYSFLAKEFYRVT